MQAARVVSGSLVTDIDMAGALWLLALPLPPRGPPPTSSIWVFPLSLSPTSSLPSIYFLLFSLVSLFSSTLTTSPFLLGLPLLAHCFPTLTPPLSHPPPHALSPCSWELLAAPSEKRPLPGPVQDRTEQGGVLQHRPPEHLLDRGGCQ